MQVACLIENLAKCIVQSALSAVKNVRYHSNRTTITPNQPILPVLIHLQKIGQTDATLETKAQRLKRLTRDTNLNNPEQVTNYIMKLKISNAYKNGLFDAYQNYADYYNITFKHIQLKVYQQDIRVALTEEINALIQSAKRPLSIKYQTLKETGLRPIELCNLKTKDFDPIRKTIRPTTAKYGTPRTLKISDRLTESLNRYIQHKNRTPNELLFKTTTKALRESHQHSRATTATKLGMPQLAKIKLYDFRHYYATILYSKTSKILYVQQQLGHKRLTTTLRYIHLVAFEEEENYTCKIACNITEATQLIESGFEYVTEMEGLKLFRKRK